MSSTSNLWNRRHCNLSIGKVQSDMNHFCASIVSSYETSATSETILIGEAIQDFSIPRKMPFAGENVESRAELCYVRSMYPVTFLYGASRKFFDRL